MSKREGKRERIKSRRGANRKEGGPRAKRREKQASYESWRKGLVGYFPAVAPESTPMWLTNSSLKGPPHRSLSGVPKVEARVGAGLRETPAAASAFLHPEAPGFSQANRNISGL